MSLAALWLRGWRGKLSAPRRARQPRCGGARGGAAGPRRAPPLARGTVRGVIAGLMTLRARLTLGFLAIAVLLLIPLGISLRALKTVEQTTETLQERELSTSQALGQALRTSANLRATETLFPLFPDDYAASLEAGVDSLAAYADSLRSAGGVAVESGAALRRSLDSLRAALPEYRAAATS